MIEATDEDEAITVEYVETARERLVIFRHAGNEATVAQNTDGYAMLMVRDAAGQEHERYYGFDMALDHAAELLGVDPRALPVPPEAQDMGM